MGVSAFFSKTKRIALTPLPFNRRFRVPVSSRPVLVLVLSPQGGTRTRSRSNSQPSDTNPSLRVRVGVRSSPNPRHPAGPSGLASGNWRLQHGTGLRRVSLEKAVGSTDCTDSTDWKPVERGCRFTLRVTWKRRSGGASGSSPSVKSVKSVDNPTAGFRFRTPREARLAGSEAGRPRPARPEPAESPAPRDQSPPVVAGWPKENRVRAA